MEPDADHHDRLFGRTTIMHAFIKLSVCSLAALAFAMPAQAQDDDGKGFYAVARAGVSINPELKFDPQNLPSSSTFDDKTKFKTGVTGQIGGGYDFGMFRVEQTIGYASNNLNVADTETGDFAVAGRTRSLSMSVAGYVDIPVSEMFVPYVGGGIGVAQVQAKLARVDGVTGAGSSYSGKDWGLMWHADVGVGIHVAPKIIVEVGGRYAQTSKLSFDGQNFGTPASYEPTLRTLSGTLGVRYMF
jgi:opacity protein-like surface antigen